MKELWQFIHDVVQGNANPNATIAVAVLLVVVVLVIVAVFSRSLGIKFGTLIKGKAQSFDDINESQIGSISTMKTKPTRRARKEFPVWRVEALDNKGKTVCSGVIFPRYSRYRIGRAENNDLILLDLSVGRRHAYVKRRAHGWFIYDNRSTNHLYNNGRRFKKLRLTDGTTVNIGDWHLVFHKM